jgi:hypothetical protein
MERDDDVPRRSKKKQRKPVDPDVDKLTNVQRKTGEVPTAMTGHKVAKKSAAKKVTSASILKKNKTEAKTSKEMTTIKKKTETKASKQIHYGQEKSKKSSK